MLGKVVFYKAKGFVTAIFLKQIFKFIFPLETLTWLNPHAPGISACFWCDSCSHSFGLVSHRFSGCFLRALLDSPSVDSGSSTGTQ